jgi:cyclin C
MAANYWVSTQRQHWQYSREQLAELRAKLEEDDRGLIQQYPLPERRHLSIYFNQRT